MALREKLGKKCAAKLLELADVIDLEEVQEHLGDLAEDEPDDREDSTTWARDALVEAVNTLLELVTEASKCQLIDFRLEKVHLALDAEAAGQQRASL